MLNSSMIKNPLKKFFLAVLAIIFFSASFVKVQAAASDYKLESVVILSRHNIRAPLSGKGSVLGKITPHQWFNWTSAPSELSMRGGELETIMGQYFRKWLTAENLITENYLPAENEVRIYANSMQRTIATAQFFSSGLFPVANVKVEHKFAPSRMDPVFNPQLTFVNEKFVTLAKNQIRDKFADKVPVEDYRLIEKVLDFKKTESAKKDLFGEKNFEVLLEVNKEPATVGTLKLACQASDAFILQYYEEKDLKAAAFGKKLSLEDWKKIAYVKDFYGDVLFTAPVVAVNVAHPLLEVMSDELARTDRKFTFLCGHDSNIASVLTALGVEDYFLPQSIEARTPIGSKLVIEKRLGADGEEYVTLKLIYQSAEQLRNKTTLTLENPPMVVPLRLVEMEQNQDGFYRLEDVQKRFHSAIDFYDELAEENQAA